VVFEGTYSTFQERQGAKLFTAIPDSNRTQLCAVIHSVPNTEEGPKLRSLVKEARKEFYGEGQLFYMYKRLNRNIVGLSGISYPASDKLFVLPLPIDETDYGNR